MPPLDEFLPDRDNRPPPASGRRDVLFMTVLLGLLALTVILWFADPAHQAGEKFRVDWPGPGPHGP